MHGVKFFFNPAISSMFALAYTCLKVNRGTIFSALAMQRQGGKDIVTCPLELNFSSAWAITSILGPHLSDSYLPLNPIGSHLTPASSRWLQLWVPMGLDEQSSKRLAVRLQFTLSNQICPIPAVTGSRVDKRW